MADVTYLDFPVQAATDTHQVPSVKSGANYRLNVRDIIDIPKIELIAGASSAANTLKKLEDGKLDIDGGNAAPMAGDIDMNGHDLLNLASAGILVKVPTIILVSDPAWAFDSRTRLALVEGIGGGGAGGGSLSNANQSSAGSGGNSGARFLGWVDVAALTAKQAAIVIGAAGVGVNGGPGGNGGNTTYQDEVNLFTAVGGIGGLVGNTGTMRWTNSDVPSNASGAWYNIRGTQGGSAYCTGTTLSATLVIRTGRGGRSPYGEGGHEVGLQGGTNGSGIQAYGRGAGGSGGYTFGTNPTTAGGNGGSGVVIIWEYM